MTDEEIASKYADENKQVYGSDEYADITDYSNIRTAFLAGLKAEREHVKNNAFTSMKEQGLFPFGKLHDLRVNPNDLPKDNTEKLCYYERGKVVARYDSKYGCWDTHFNNLVTVIPSSVIIAWCDTPAFEQG